MKADYVLVFDGGSRGNPGLGYGSYAITRLQDGRRHVERLDFGAGVTNNEAEYDSLIAGLEDLLGRIQAAGRSPREFAVEVLGDSALVVNQVNGLWKIREPRMRVRCDEVRDLLGRFAAHVVRKVERRQIVAVLGH